MAIRTEAMGYEGDGLTMVGTLHLDDSNTGPRPGVLLFPEAFGPGKNLQSRADRLAKLGFAALACDLHGNGVVLGDIATVLGLLDPIRPHPERIRARTTGALAALAARSEVDASRIAAIGYCFGGTMALELARSGAAIRGVVGFHSGLATTRPEDAANIRCPILACIGADDPGIPPPMRAAFEDEMRAGKVDWRLHLYGGVVHSFTNPDADAMNQPDFARYDAGADARSWAEMRAFFDEIF